MYAKHTNRRKCLSFLELISRIFGISNLRKPDPWQITKNITVSFIAESFCVLPCVSALFESRHERTCLRDFGQVNSNRSAQLQKLARMKLPI